MSKPKETPLLTEGVVLSAFPSAQFSIQIDSGNIVMAVVAGKLRQNFIRIVPGDRVRVELSPYDLTRGRIVYREH